MQEIDAMAHADTCSKVPDSRYDAIRKSVGVQVSIRSMKNIKFRGS